MSLYDTLGINKGASQDEIKQAYRKKAKDNHEDKGGDHDAMSEVNKAYGVLKDPVKRDRYDKTGETDGQSFEARFQGYVQQIFMNIVEGNDPDYTDLIGEFKAYTSAVIEDNGKRVKDAKGRLKKLEKVAKRVKKDGDNRIGMVLEHNMENVRQEIGIIEENVEFMKKCLAHLEMYGYEVDERPKLDSSYPFKVSLWPDNFGFTIKNEECGK